MELVAQVLLERIRDVVESTPTPGFHAEARESSRYWNWRVMKAFIDAGMKMGGYTVLPPQVKFHVRSRRITRSSTDHDEEAARMPQVVDVAWMRDHRFCLEDYEHGQTGLVAAFMCEWGSDTPYHVKDGQMNWEDVRCIMGAFSKLAFVKAPLKVMAFSTRSMVESSGDSWDFLANMMVAQAKAMFRYYPVREEYVLMAWPHQTASLTNFRYRIVKVG